MKQKTQGRELSTLVPASFFFSDYDEYAVISYSFTRVVFYLPFLCVHLPFVLRGRSVDAVVLSAEVRPGAGNRVFEICEALYPDGLLFCRMIGEAGSFASLAEYRRVRQIGAIYNNSGKSRAEIVSEFAAQNGYKDESGFADELLTIARRNRSIVSLYCTEQDEDSEETGEDVTRDDSWNYADILWNGIQAKAVAAAFEQLSYTTSLRHKLLQQCQTLL